MDTNLRTKADSDPKRRRRKVSTAKTGTKVIRVAYILLITLALLLPANPAPTVAAQNPPPKEIAAIFDKVAREYQVPAEILKAIAYLETGWRQWDKNGKVVINRSGNPDYIGIMQVGTYDPRDTRQSTDLKTTLNLISPTGQKPCSPNGR